MSEYIQDLQKLLYKPTRKYIPSEINFKYKISYYRFSDFKIYEGYFLTFLANDDELRVWLNDKLKNKNDIYILSIVDLSKKFSGRDLKGNPNEVSPT